MPVVGFKLDSIKAEKSGNRPSVNVTSGPQILSIEEKKDVIKGLKNVMAMKFRFETKYEDIGTIEMEGEILYQSDNMRKILKEWEKSKSLDPDAAVEVLNFIFRKCLTHAVYLSEMLQLPPPIRFPVVTKEKPKENYIN